MESLGLTLKMMSNGWNMVSIPLYLKDDQPLSINDIYEPTKTVCSDLSYKISLEGNDIDINDVQQVQFFVNDNYIVCNIRNNICEFINDSQIFQDCYGYVEISLLITLKSGKIINACTKYIHVLVKNTPLNNTVQNMIQYIYNNQEELLSEGEAKSNFFGSLKENGQSGLESQLILAYEIANLYEQNFAYFKANYRFKITKEHVIDRFEKAYNITPETIQYITQHPEEFRQTLGKTGVCYGNKTYQPAKTLLIQNAYSADIYENRVVVSFLRHILFQLDDMSLKIDNILNNIPNYFNASDEYIYSCYYIFMVSKKKLTDNKHDIGDLKNRFEKLYNCYKQILNTSEIDLNKLPKPTAIFLGVPQYNMIYKVIYKWSKYGIYNFKNNDYMLSFRKISSIYEVYLLTKLIQYFKSLNFSLTESSPCYYPVKRRWSYINTTCNNTYQFVKKNKIITLYYQPVVYDEDSRKINDIGLYRNNSCSLSKDFEGGHYYVPDFIIKVREGEKSKYMICDAKYSSCYTVKMNYVSQLAFKYIFSISPISKNDSICGLCIFNGQELDDCKINNIYDKELPQNTIKPFAQIVSITEGISNDEHFNVFNQLFNII